MVAELFPADRDLTVASAALVRLADAPSPGTVPRHGDGPSRARCREQGWIGSASCDGPVGGSWAARSARSAGGSSAASASGVVWTGGEDHDPAARRGGDRPGHHPRRHRGDRHVRGADRRWSASCRRSAPGCGATPRSASRTASRPTCASACSRTSSACTSRSTTRRRPVSSWRARTPTSSRSTRSSSCSRSSLASCSSLVGVVVVMCSKSVGARAARARRAAAPQHRGDPLLAPHRAGRRSSSSRSSATSRASSRRAVAGVRVVKGFGAEQLQVERLEAEADAVLDQALDGGAAARRASSRSSTSCPRSRSSRSSGTAATSCSTASSQVGDLVAFNSTSSCSIWPLRMTGHARRAGVARVGVGGPDPRDPRHRPRDRRPAAPGARCRRTARASCASRACAFAYGDGPPVLDGLDLVVRGGEAVARRRADRRAARRPSRGCSRASTTSTTAACCSTASTCAT